MAILCPFYNTVLGWYIIVHTENGPHLKPIPGIIQYYKSMNVDPNRINKNLYKINVLSKEYQKKKYPQAPILINLFANSVGGKFGDSLIPFSIIEKQTNPASPLNEQWIASESIQNLASSSDPVVKLMHEFTYAYSMKTIHTLVKRPTTEDHTNEEPQQSIEQTEKSDPASTIEKVPFPEEKKQVNTADESENDCISKMPTMKFKFEDDATEKSQANIEPAKESTENVLDTSEFSISFSEGKEQEDDAEKSQNDSIIKVPTKKFKFEDDTDKKTQKKNESTEESTDYALAASEFILSKSQNDLPYKSLN